ncbi:MAG: hypothetical protein FWE80_06260 [Oscillospiraceae bacterium]|nr:hypothetical protein [Oscillospiraceae bacterium]
MNRQVIEVSETGHPFFERAILILRADCADPPGTRLQEEGRRFIQAAGSYTGMRMIKKKNRIRRMIQGCFLLTGGALAGVLLSWLIRA